MKSETIYGQTQDNMSSVVFSDVVSVVLHSGRLKLMKCVDLMFVLKTYFRH